MPTGFYDRSKYFSSPEYLERNKKISLSKLGSKYKPMSIQGRKNISKGKKGIKLSEEHKSKLGKHCIGEKNHKWKGDEISYRPLHLWVQKNLGNPSKCAKCGKDNLKGRKIHWANISREYKRDLKDWVRLYAKCHGEFDKGLKRKLKK